MFRIRYRVRISKKLNVPTEKHSIVLNSADVTVSSHIPDTPIKDNEWIVFSTKGFQTKEEAKVFGEKLKVSCELGSILTKVGLDSGIDLATSSFGSIVKEAGLKQGVVYRDNVHGLDVFEDDPRVRFPVVTGSGTVLFDPKIFFGAVDSTFNSPLNLSEESLNTILLLNYALMRQDPVGQIVFAFSAVESIGQNEKWSEPQKEVIKKLAFHAQTLEVGTPQEREEVCIALRNGLHKVSLRQGVIRLLNRIGLSQLRSKWDSLYQERSTLIHGLAPQPGVRYDEFASHAINLCGHILLNVVSTEAPIAKEYANKFYPI